MGDNNGATPTYTVILSNRGSNLKKDKFFTSPQGLTRS